MTLAEARRILGCDTNYQLAKATGIPEYKLSRWKKRNNRVPEDQRPAIWSAFADKQAAKKTQ